MIEAEEAVFELFVSNQQLAKAIEPAVRDLHNPPPGALRRMPPLLFGFLTPPFDVWDVAVFFDDAQCQFAGIASIGAQVLAASLGRQRTFHYDGIQNRGKLADIMAICSGHDDRQRDATAVHQ